MIDISLKVLPKVTIENESAFIYGMAWCWIGDMPLSEPMIAYLIDANIRPSASVSWCYTSNKYWNWCRCIQRKDSAGVILTASWFNNINIGYRFHTSTVCHSCCNNVMYISKENLDISGSAWKKISCWHGIPAGTDCPSTEIIYTGRELCSLHASISSQIAARFWHIIYDIYWYLHYISMIVINVYNN